MNFHLPHYVIFLVILFLSTIISISIWLTVQHLSATDSENCINDETDGELIFVHVVLRHGARTPLRTVPTSQYADPSYWPEGWGQLTTLGVQQAYSLGQWFRCRYKSFLGDEYNLKDIYVRSSDTDRTLMSAQSVLAGLYPPTGKQIWKRNIPWRPIPVHTIPISMDYLTAGRLPTCPSFDNAMEQYLNSDEIKNYLKSIQPTLDSLTLNAGAKIDTLEDVLYLRDTWDCESTQGYTLPQWVDEFYPNNEVIEQTAIKYLRKNTATKFLAKFHVGFLLKDILDRFTSKMENSLTPNQKMWMYSTHDVTVFSLLRLLDVTDIVPLAGSLMFELRKYGSDHYLQVFYKNTDKNPELIPIPGCGPACPLSKLYSIYDDVIPKRNLDTECLIPDAADRIVLTKQ